jgi:hypothetical protein
MKIKISITRPEDPDNRGRITDNGYPSHSDTGRITAVECEVLRNVKFLNPN